MCAEEGIVSLITAKKQTRTEAYYQVKTCKCFVHGTTLYIYLYKLNCTSLQVAWLGQEERMTWEPASTLPQVLIEEFESGMVGTGQMITDARFGVFNHTLVVETSKVPDAPLAKKLKTTNPLSNPGYVQVVKL